MIYWGFGVLTDVYRSPQNFSRNVVLQNLKHQLVHDTSGNYAEVCQILLFVGQIPKFKRLEQRTRCRNV